MTNLRILCVDDNPRNLESLDNLFFSEIFQGMLASLDARVVELKCCNSALEAIELIKSENFNLILTDLFMPGEDTKAYCKELGIKDYNPNEKVPYGFSIAIQSLMQNIKVCIVSELDHHAGFLQSILSDKVTGSRFRFPENLINDYFNPKGEECSVYFAGNNQLAFIYAHFNGKARFKSPNEKNLSLEDKEMGYKFTNNSWVSALLFSICNP